MYKYRILELLYKLPRSSEKQLREYLPEQIGVSYDTFRSWLYIKNDSGREIRAKALVQIAAALNVELIELFNDPPTCFTLDEIKAEAEANENEQL